MACNRSKLGGTPFFRSAACRMRFLIFRDNTLVRDFGDSKSVYDDVRETVRHELVPSFSASTMQAVSQTRL